MQLVENEIKNALIFLERVELKGTESMAHAELLLKLKAMHQELAKPAIPDPLPEPLPELDED